MESTGSEHGSVAGCHEPPVTLRFLFHLIRMAFCNDCQSLSSSLCNFLHPPSKVQIFTASPNSSSLNAMDQVAHPYKHILLLLLQLPGQPHSSLLRSVHSGS